MSSEQKNLMGVVSTRQAIYVGVGGIVIYSYVPILFGLLKGLFGWMIASAICGFTTIPIIAFVAFFGFYPVEKYNMNRDYYMMIKIQRGTQVGMWRKGR